MTARTGTPFVGVDARGSDPVAGYRAAVEDLSARWGECSPVDGGIRRLAAADRDALGSVLDALPGGAEGVLTRLDHQVRGFRPTTRSSVRTPAQFARLLLLQQIDVLWWSTRLPFADDAAVAACPGLVSLRTLRQAGRIDFNYKLGTSAWSTRVRNYAVRRWAPLREPRTSGLSYDLARPAMVGLLNDVAGRFAAAAPHWSRGLWVNCLVRSETVQQHLRDLGYPAAPGSSHCVGYAADVEMDWLERHGQADALRAVLLDLRDSGTINVIDEGQVWHICLNPAHVTRYEFEPRRPAVRAPEERPCAG